MATPSFGDADFLIGYCDGCGKEVLTHIDLGPDDVQQRRCLHCDVVISGGLRAVTGDELEANGYALVEARTCGNGGGCSAGGCGARVRG